MLDIGIQSFKSLSFPPGRTLTICSRLRRFPDPDIMDNVQENLRHLADKHPALGFAQFSAALDNCRDILVSMDASESAQLLTQAIRNTSKARRLVNKHVWEHASVSDEVGLAENTAIILEAKFCRLVAELKSCVTNRYVQRVKSLVCSDSTLAEEHDDRCFHSESGLFELKEILRFMDNRAPALFPGV